MKKDPLEKIIMLSLGMFLLVPLVLAFALDISMVIKVLLAFIYVCFWVGLISSIHEDS